MGQLWLAYAHSSDFRQLLLLIIQASHTHTSTHICTLKYTETCKSNCVYYTGCHVTCIRFECFNNTAQSLSVKNASVFYATCQSDSPPINFISFIFDYRKQWRETFYLQGDFLTFPFLILCSRPAITSRHAFECNLIRWGEKERRKEKSLFFYFTLLLLLTDLIDEL